MEKTKITWPIIIVGGGPVGLSASIYLSLQGIKHILFERYPGTSIHPKAVGLNPRTMEIFKELGVEAEVLKQRAPPETAERTAWRTAIGPEGRQIFARDAWKADYYRTASPSTYAMLPQIRLEPILHKRACELNPEGIHHNAEVVDVAEDADSATVSVKHRGDDTIDTYRARFIIAADGGRTVTDKLGIKWEGEWDVNDMVTCHLRASLSKFLDPSTLITWLINPRMGGTIGTGILYHLGPYPSKGDTEEWSFVFGTAPGDPDQFDTEKVLERARKSMGVPDLQFEVLNISHWSVQARVAEKYRSSGGRIFLVGDAAHRIPPWGALGLNTGIQDVQNLVWKLGLAINGDDGSGKFDRLLDTYGEERHPIGQRVASSSLYNLRSHGLGMDKALGLSIENDPEANVQALERYFDESHADHAAVREAVSAAQVGLDLEFHATGAEVGWFYPSADINNEGAGTNHDGALLSTGELDCTNYHPSTIPGHQVPHAWLEKDGVILSTRNLAVPGKFILLVQNPNEWRKTTNEYVKMEVIDGQQGWVDRDGSWAQTCGVGENGAVLMRPDRIVAWRGQACDEGLLAEFDRLVLRLLNLSV